MYTSSALIQFNVTCSYANNGSGVVNCQRCSEVNRSNLFWTVFIRGNTDEFVSVPELVKAIVRLENCFA